jgi:alkanesulfonate monooxygenase SsuD/methylene tetrahydromethanopterin reductase-like flavin-dependent oxidoreductase (luciferase family)|tara:strand:- start:13143 stop:14243 length:1101 start_codon:yes stop_codon:yes gene_type:complete
MKFGIFFEQSVPRPWDGEIEHTVYQNALEQARLADELGFHSVWAVEHHFLEEYSHCSAPDVFLSAIAAQTKRVRVGHGIVVCVPGFNHPIRIAERAAVLDIISSGRLELGTGRSATWPELGGFQSNPEETKKSWDEYIHCIPKMWTQERFEYQGEYFSMPSRAVLPKPYQKPHPPLWVAVSSPGTETDAADRGMGALGVSFTSFAAQEKKVKAYHERIANCDPVGEFVNNQMASVNFLYCHPDDEQGVKIGRSMMSTFQYMASQNAMAKEIYPTSSYPTGGLLAATRRQADGPGDARGAPEGIAIGNPKNIIEQLKKWEASGVDHVNFMLNAVEVIPQERVLDSLRLFAKEVMPAFEKSELAEVGS